MRISPVVLSKLSIATLTLTSLALAAGCSAEAGDVTGAASQKIEGPGQSPPAAEVRARLALSYENGGARAAEGAFVTLDLAADGTFSGTTQPGRQVRCFRAPCTLPASGLWRSEATSGGFTRVLIVIGSRVAATFRAVEAADGGPVTLVDEKDPKYALTSLRTCMSADSADCGRGEYCTVAQGDCRSSGMLAVCSGVCRAR